MHTCLFLMTCARVSFSHLLLRIISLISSSTLLPGVFDEEDTVPLRELARDPDAAVPPPPFPLLVLSGHAVSLTPY